MTITESKRAREVIQNQYEQSILIVIDSDKSNKMQKEYKKWLKSGRPILLKEMTKMKKNIKY
jgi:hypothetical protein